METADHRPWPLPARPWVMGQTWDELLFAHWRVSAAAVREHLPDGLDVDEHDGSAWLGITPFRITGLRLRGMLPLHAELRGDMAALRSECRVELRTTRSELREDVRDLRAGVATTSAASVTSSTRRR